MGLTCLTGLATVPCHAQEKSAQAGVSTSIGSDGTGTIIVEAHGQLPKPPVFYTATAQAMAQVGPESIEQVIEVVINVIQGEPKTLSFGLNGAGQVTDVQAENLQSWSIRQDGTARFLDLQLKEHVTELSPVIKLRSAKLEFPADVEVMHLTPGESVGFNSTVNLNYDSGVVGIIREIRGFAPLDSDGSGNRFQTTTGGQIKLSLNRNGAAPGPVELTDTSLRGDVHANGKSIGFQLRSTAHVSQANAELIILSGNAAVERVPSNDDFRLRLATENGRPVYKIVFAEPGTFPVELDFVAPLAEPRADWRSMDFTIAAGAVVPLTLKGLDAGLEFQRDRQAVVPLRDNDAWLGFLPATGRARPTVEIRSKSWRGKTLFHHHWPCRGTAGCRITTSGSPD